MYVDLGHTLGNSETSNESSIIDTELRIYMQ